MVASQFIGWCESHRIIASVPLGTRHHLRILVCRCTYGTPVSHNILLYQPMNWLATPIPSLRDFTRGIIVFHARRALHGGNAALHVP